VLVHGLLAASAARHPGRTALVCEGRVFTFADLDLASDRVARALQRGGLARGDRAAIVAANVAESVVAVFAVMKAGGVVVPVSPLTKAKKLAGILSDCAVAALISGPASADLVGEAARDVPSLTQVVWTGEPAAGARPGATFAEILAGPHAPPQDPRLVDHDLCAIIYTSGTTARPKGVMLTHRNLLNTTWAIAKYLGNVPEDVVMCALPLSHTYGLCQVLVGARVGYSVVLERSFAYPFDVLTRMQTHRVTGLPGVPTMFAQILEIDGVRDLDLSSLRYMTNAAAGIAPAQIRRLAELLPNARFFSMYGLTECTRACFLDPSRLADKIDSVGGAIPNSEAYVVDDEGRRAAAGVVGELVIRGANVMRGYWGRPEETAACLRDGEIPGEKVLHTGDLFRTDAEGFLYFVGRRDDVFKCKGEKVSPREIENVLCELDEVLEAAVLGVNEPMERESIEAAVVLRSGSTISEQRLRRHCRERLESYLVPSRIEIRDALPKTENGKLDRSALLRGRPGAERRPV
jgi:long-chain acyl-CoA synthetase